MKQRSQAIHFRRVRSNKNSFTTRRIHFASREEWTV